MVSSASTTRPLSRISKHQVRHHAASFEAVQGLIERPSCGGVFLASSPDGACSCPPARLHLPALLFPRRIGRNVRTGSNARLSACKRDQDSGCSGPRRCLARIRAGAVLRFLESVKGCAWGGAPSRSAARHGGHGLGVLPMTDSPAILLAGGGPKTRPRGRVLAPARYRHPGDVIRLIAAALVLAVAAVIALLLPALLRPAAVVTGVGPATATGRVLTGLVQVMIAAAALVLLAAALRYRRFRVLATVAGGFAAAAALMAGITYLAGPGGPAPAGLRQGSWLAGAGFPDPAVLAGLAAVAVAAAPWLSPVAPGAIRNLNQ